MVEIKDRNIFGKVIAEALVKIHTNGTLRTWEAKRWENALAKAAAEIEDHGVFMDWQEDKQTLLIWSDRSNNIYEANGVCQCQAYAHGFPCWHKTAKQLIKNYFAALEAVKPAPVKMEHAKYLKPSSNAKPASVGGLRI